jgi:amino acid adenylation domain-containing protein
VTAHAVHPNPPGAAHAGAAPAVEPHPQHQADAFPLLDLQTAFVVGDGEAMEFHVRPHYYVETEWPGLDPKAWERALSQALRRQQQNLVVLRPDLQLQAIGRFQPVQVPVHDLRGLPPHEQQQALRATRERLSRGTLPLDRWPWMQAEISLHGQGDAHHARLHWNNNNFFCDGHAMFALLDEVKRRLEQPDLPLPALPLAFRDCVLALQRTEESALGQQSRSYWLQRLPQLPEPPPLPLRKGLVLQRRSWLQRREAVLPAEAWSAFKRLAQRQGLTPTNALFAAYAELLSRWSGSRHFLLNNMVNHRATLGAGVREVLGNFATLYPLEVDWRRPGPFVQRARLLQQRVAQDLQHTHWSGARVLQALNQQRKTPGRAPCPFVLGSSLHGAPLPAPHVGCLETPQVMLDHQFWPLQDGGLWIVWDVIEDCFPEGLVDAMWQAWQALLQRLSQDAAAWSCEGFDLLPPAQQARRRQANDTEYERPAGLLHDGLAEGARRWSGRPAVRDGAQLVSYGSLSVHANRLTHLLREAGVTRGDRVAVLLDKGWHQVAAVHGVLAAGAAYVPLAPDWPPARIDRLLQDVQARHVFTSRALRATLPWPAGVQAWCVDDDEAQQRWPSTPPAPMGQPGDLAYVLFTSGSTGAPKGVMIDHRGAMNTIADVNRRFGIGAADVAYGLSALGFDLSVYDLFGPLAVGATLVLPAAADVQQPAAWLRDVQTHGVTLWNSVPALAQLLVDAAQAQDVQLPALRTVLLSGDWIPLGLPGQLKACAPRAAVWSLGGATEASIWSIVHPADQRHAEAVSIPYGRPLANQRWHVLHDDGHDAPDWVPGQLHVAGDGLALGYWGDADKTAAAFVPHPRSGEQLYRTGDIGRYLPDGSIEFLGRADFQVKLNGLRVELGEVEQAVLAHPAVEAAVALACGAAAGRRLEVFVVPRGREALDGEAVEGEAVEGEAVEGKAVDGQALREAVRQHLPAAMLPSRINTLPALPLTATGKVDRQALQRLADRTHDAARPAPVPPRNAVEQALAAIWREVLDLPAVGVHDDFFDLGGQSFAAMRVMTRVAAHFGRQLPLGVLLQARSIAQLAERLAEPVAERWGPAVAPAMAPLTAAAPGWSPLVTLQAAGTGTPLFLVHPAGGGVLCYRALAAQLGRPVHGLQAAGLQGEQPPLQDLGEMAALYVAALNQAWPTGPCLLGGWSSGGVIAFEMARQLEAQGRTVAPLLMIDSPAPMQHEPVDADTLARWLLHDLGASVPAPVRAVVDAVVLATRRYRPSPAGLRAGISVLRAAQGQVPEFAGHPAAAAADWGWSAFTRGPVQATLLPGDHHTLWSPPNDAALLAAVLAALPEGDTRHPSIHEEGSTDAFA